MINSKVKGRKGEAEVENILRAHGFETKHSGWNEGPDIVCRYEGQDEPTTIEVKRKNIGSASIYEELKEADEVWHRANGQDWMVTVKAKDYLALRLLAKGTP